MPRTLPSQVLRFAASAAVIVLLAVHSSAQVQQKPAPRSPSSQVQLEGRVKDLEIRLNEAEQKAASAAMEKDYVIRIQKQHESYCKEALAATHTATIIAAATVIYVVITALLWLQTKRAANAATTSAKAAKQSADALTALHRPFIGLESLPTEKLTSNTIWKFPAKLWNYGTLPASHLNASFEFYTESTQESLSLHRTIEGPESAEIFPNSGYKIDLLPALKPEQVSQIASQSKKLILTVKATYSVPDGHKFGYTARAILDTTSGGFVLSKSETHPI